jgi:hypothetical protein
MVKFRILTLLTFTLMGSAARAETSRWEGSEISLGHYASVFSFYKAAELTWNPLLAEQLAVEPRYRLNDRISFLAHLGLEVELTNADDTTNLRQPLLDDLFVEGSYRLASLPWELQGEASVRLTLPTSLDSIARERLLGIAPALTLRKPVALTDKISMGIIAGLRLSVTGALANSAQYDAPAIASCAVGSESCDQFDHAGSRSSWFSMTETIGADVTFSDKVSARLVAQLVQSRLYALDRAIDPATGMEIDPGANDTIWRYRAQYELAATWRISRRVQLDGGFQTVNPTQKPSSAYYTPFFNRYTQVFAKTAYVF